MIRNRSIAPLLAAALLALPAAAAAQEADRDAQAEARADEAAAKEVKEEANLDLDERIKPVSGRMFAKDGRHELTPTVGLSLNDGFFSKYTFGLRYAYHFGEEWSAGLNAAYALSSPSGAVTRCDSSGQNCEVPTKDDLARTPGDMGLIGSVDLSWAPLYGKISVLAEKVLHFDTYGVVGAGFVESKMAPPDGSTVESTIAPALHLGVGQRYFVSRNATLRFEIRDVLYQTEVFGRSGELEKDLQNQLLFTIGLSWFLGDGPES
ncbi:outer membrane beta-barrel domain-containing protein [Vulgatibacter sp.]|uniref:outer membrane beta-barrel domain-containing protein n=1 Tax=Vulgatibacter sp. TaxID=1971226 RepID=UPI0035671277